MAHELPYDDPEALRRRLRDPLPDPDRPGPRRRQAADHPPSARARRPGDGPTRSTAPSPGSTGPGSSSPTWRWLWILARDPERFARSARQMSAVYDLGCADLLRPSRRRRRGGRPSRPHARDEVAPDHGGGRRGDLGRAWPLLYELPRRQPMGGDALAALRHLADGGAAARRGRPRRAAPPAGPTPRPLGFALVYLGEHYVVDLFAGRGARGRCAPRRAARRAARAGVSRGVQRLERIANG